ncbi:hypothetical protein GCM10010196_10850 [Agromyces mediolanus]|uniref:Uncharacterized protein n=1 Tax=Agromyces mediolanus TaxID=41986 RepID=A0A918CEF0_AGRME|nr:hypothetical protein GCM10010196_10850 [Agromyces mediolanus]GLJ71300.1 hypothetical protein GCM10017583_05560 [Agromyces mediolanus]
MKSMYAPPMMPVASTDSVSRYTQKVSANQRKLVVTFATIVFTSTWANVRMPFAGGAGAGGAGAVGADAAGAGALGAALSSAVGPRCSSTVRGYSPPPTSGTPLSPPVTPPGRSSAAGEEIPGRIRLPRHSLLPQSGGGWRGRVAGAEGDGARGAAPPPHGGCPEASAPLA